MPAQSVKERSNSKPVLAFPCPRKLIHQQTENWRTFPLLPAVSNFSRGATLKFEEFCLICCKDWCKFSSFEHFSLWKPEERETVRRNAETGGIFTFCSFEHSENLKEEKLWGATRKLEESCPFFCKDWCDSFLSSILMCEDLEKRHWDATRKPEQSCLFSAKIDVKYVFLSILMCGDLTLIRDLAGNED